MPPGKGGSPGKQSAIISARRARRERSELKREHTGGMRAALAALAARAALRAQMIEREEGIPFVVEILTLR